MAPVKAIAIADNLKILPKEVLFSWLLFSHDALTVPFANSDVTTND